jgi:hypothetical protein
MTVTMDKYMIVCMNLISIMLVWYGTFMHIKLLDDIEARRRMNMTIRHSILYDIIGF